MRGNAPGQGIPAVTGSGHVKNDTVLTRKKE